MAKIPGSGASVPAKIMAVLAIFVVLGLGLCGAGAAAHGDTLPEYLFIAGACSFWGGLLLLAVFGVGWAIFAVVKSLSGKKEQG